MRVIKKNQIIIVLISFCLILVGYLNYSNNKKNDETVIGDITNYTEGMGDAKLVSSEAVEEVDENTTENDIVDNEEVTETASDEVEQIQGDDYFTESKMERNNIYSQSIDIYESMLESNTITNEQKSIAQNEIQKITSTKNTILIVENLIKVKGFEDVVVFENGGNISVIVKAEQLQPEQVAQIQNIVSREFNITSDKISITNR